jgi:superfamily II DNA or RNA helicase
MRSNYSSIRDNKNRGSVGQFLIDNIKSEADLLIVSAYFTIYAYNHLKAQLDNIHGLKFLFGEPTFIKSLDPTKINKRDFKIEDDKIIIPIESRMVQKAVARECSDWIRSKVEIKSMVKPNFLHGKMYHITQQSGVEKAIAGSSNFTVNGLGLGGSPNIELNLIVDNDRDRADLKAWFYELWNDDTGLVQDVKKDVLKYLEQLYLDNEPEFIYYKTLFHVFGKFLGDQEKGGLLNEKTGFFDSEIWEMLYDFQKDGVKGAINKIINYNGCIIADSVGLGKTFEALAIIRYFELLNQRVLVLCPKKLSENWTIYQASKNNTLNPFKKDRFNYHVLYHTDMGRAKGFSDADNQDLSNFNWGAYDLVVIDESHNFRGNPKENENEKGEKKMNRAMWLMEKIIKSGSKTKILLLSATPVNNNLRDLRNQVFLITEGKTNALEEATQIKDIAQTLKLAQTQFTNWADPKKNPSRNLKELLEKLGTDFTKLLDTLTIARSRKHIVKFYDEKKIGKFPVRLKPHSIYPNIDIEDKFFTYDTLNKKILDYKLSLFNPSKYVKEELKSKYGIKTKEEKALAKKERRKKKKQKLEPVLSEQKSNEPNFDQSDREYFLIQMMKVNFLKRLESSVESFEISMKRTLDKIEKLEKEIKEFLQKKNDKDAEYEASAFETDEDEKEELPDELDAWEIGKKLKFKLLDLNLDDWLTDLRNDREALYDIYLRAKDVEVPRDAKLKELKHLIAEKQKSKLNGENKKVIIFTAFADTAQYLFDSIKDYITKDLKLNIALVEGSKTATTFGENKFSAILTNFSPVSKNRIKMERMPQDGEIDVMIATDCISEGQNLQDCDFLINYDIHWNPVRIIQRFGRIDRLGSQNEKIQLVNFWPTKDLDNYINLKERVEARMALVDITATGEDNILNTEQIEELITDDLKYRNQQLKRLKDEVLDLEDMNESISLTDFTLDDFRVDLMNYLDTNREKLENAPMGLYAVVPALSGPHAQLREYDLFSTSQADIVKSGVIYCLKQIEEVDGSEEVNPLQPYFLVYVRDDGTVRFNYIHAKQILEMYRLLCGGKTQTYELLCDLFNHETNNGAAMEKYSALLKSAVGEISRLFKKRNLQTLTASRNVQIISKDKQAEEINHFELVTWLVIK